MKPALTAEEWTWVVRRRVVGWEADGRTPIKADIPTREVIVIGDNGYAGAYFGADPEGNITIEKYAERLDICEPGEKHALAALCLHGQPFGFTRKDVGVLARAAFGAMSDTNDAGEPDAASAEALRHIADRIAALLAPEDA